MRKRAGALAASAICVGLAIACTERAPEQVPDTAAVARPVITRHAVNEDTYGMSAQVRWAFSPDRRAVLVTVDPVSVEAEPVWDGFFFGVEEPAFSVQVDSVWDVAPAPDWRAVVFSRAHRVSNGESPVPDRAWSDLARTTGIDSATLRASSFPASGMVSYSHAVAQPGVIRAPNGVPRMYPIPRGWRVRWTTDGRFIALGANPTGAQDDNPSTGWSALDPTTGQLSTALPAGARMVDPRWVVGPELFHGMQVQLDSAAPIRFKRGGTNYVIESRRGVITLRDPAFQTSSIPVGPGVALAATANARYVVALAPRSTTRQYELPVEIVVYEIVF